jgi:uncharacterized protein YjbJ (UPF0337 family)
MSPRVRRSTAVVKHHHQLVADHCFLSDKQKDSDMNKDRIDGAAKQAKGAVKEAVGSVFGDTKLEAEGKGDKVEGKIQNALGGAEDALSK